MTKTEQHKRRCKEEQAKWQNVLGIHTVDDLNQAITEGRATDIINVSEAFQDKKICEIADAIVKKKARLVLLAGPSSSGKTTTCKRLSITLTACGLRTHSISTDDFFVNREDTPLDENGEYDFESLDCLDTKLFGETMAGLLDGRDVMMPRFNFASGKREWREKPMHISYSDVLLIEGTHALNPQLTQLVEDKYKFRIYVSPVTTISLDGENYLSTKDLRLMRRLIRDSKYRGQNASEILHRFPSVIRGEEKWILPFREEADVFFNSSLLYEISVIRTQAMPLVESVKPGEERYEDACRLKNIMQYFRRLPSKQVPMVSLLREFAGGSAFDY
jgi:uridine kinase